MTFIDRRTLLAGAGLFAAGIALPPRPAFAQDAAASDTRIRIAPGRQRLAPEPAGETEVLGFAGRAGGPLPRLKAGQAAALSLENAGPEPVSIHWHGLRGPNALDGVAGLTGDAVPPGGTARLSLPEPQAGLHLARPCLPGRSGELAERGLTGLLVVEEREPPPVDRDVVCLVDDVRLEADGTFSPFGRVEERSGAGRLGNALLVNGAPAPLAVAVPPGGRLRLRIANGCNARSMRIGFESLRAWVIAVDGNPTETFEPLQAALPFAPGSRYDLLVEAPEPGAGGRVAALIGGGVALVTIVSDPAAGTALVGLPPPAALQPHAQLPAEIRLERATRADIVIEGGARPVDGKAIYTGDPAAIWTLNGAAGEVARGKPLASVRRDTPIVLALVNRTAFPQPMHLHGHAFRLLHALDDGWEPYWLDTTIVPAGQTQRIAFVADNPGRWLVASTVLERLDTGLFGWIEVA